MNETPTPEPELPPSLRFLKRLVTVLTLTMILGVITVVGLLVTRLRQADPVATLPEGLTLPAGTSMAAVTFGTSWIAIVTAQDHILIYDKSGKLHQDLRIDIKLP